MKKAYFSKRIQKKRLSLIDIQEIGKSIQLFNQSKRFAFQTIVREKRWNRSLHEDSLQIRMKKKFELNDYFVNSARQEAKSLFSSRIELNKLYIKQADEEIRSVNKKLKAERMKLTKLRKIKESCIKGNLRFPKHSRFSLHKSGLVSQTLRNRSAIWFNAYLFEHQYLDVQIKQLKAKIGRLTHKLFRLQQKKEKLKHRIPSAVFGTKKLFQYQYTKEEYIYHPKNWREDFTVARNKQMMISGRRDAGSGNFVFHYNVETKELLFTSVGGKVITIPNVVFPYGEDEVNEAVTKQVTCKNKREFGKPISWVIEDHGTYYIVKCLIDVEEEKNSINFSTSAGVLGVDCNVNHFAWVNISRDGNYLESGKITFSLEGKTSGQITKIIEAEAIRLVDLAARKMKPIVLEKLDITLSKMKNPYGNKKANRLMSLFAYRKMIEAIKNRANKMGVAILEVNPAYTSISGKFKYIRKFGISIHQAAAFTIGRRGLGYKEKAPKVLKPYIVQQDVHHWSQWNTLNKKLNVRTHLMYQLYNVHDPKQGIDFEHADLTELEKKQVTKAFA